MTGARREDERRTELGRLIDRLTPSERGRLVARLKEYDRAKRDVEWLMRPTTQRKW